jgi:hypothetical protein
MASGDSMKMGKGGDYKAAKVAAKKKAMSKVTKSPVKGGGKMGKC